MSPRLQSDAEDADLEAARAPRRPIECIARVEDALVADECRDQVQVKLSKCAVVDQQHDRVGISQRLFDR